MVFPCPAPGHALRQRSPPRSFALLACRDRSLTHMATDLGVADHTLSQMGAAGRTRRRDTGDAGAERAFGASCAARCARCVRSGDGIYRAAAERVFATLAIELPARHRFPPTERHPTRALRRHRGVLAHPPQGFRAGGALTRGRRAGEVCSPRRSLTASCPPHRETPMFSRMCLSGQVDDGFHLFYYFLC